MKRSQENESERERERRRERERETRMNERSELVSKQSVCLVNLRALCFADEPVIVRVLAVGRLLDIRVHPTVAWADKR